MGVSPPLILGFFLNSPDILKYFFLDIFVELYERYAPALGREEAPKHFFRRTAITSPDCQEFMV